MINSLGKDFNLFRKDMGVSATAMHQYGKVIGGYINPSIIEERQMNIASMDVFSRLLMDRIIFLGTGIDDTVGNIITAQLLFLNSIDQNSDIQLYISSGGGSVISGLSILDTMEFISNDVSTMVTGIAASMAFVLAISGTKGKRSALKHSIFMQHQPSIGGVGGTASDILITAREIEKTRTELYKIISDKTGQPYEKVEKDCDRDYWMTSQETIDYGGLDQIAINK